MAERGRPVDVAERSIRQSSTPCQSGVVGDSSNASGSCETGKNVPENRNIGTIRKRKIVTKVLSFSTLAERAIGIENARPDQHRDRDDEQAEPRGDGAEGGDDREVRGRRRGRA